MKPSLPPQENENVVQPDWYHLIEKDLSTVSRRRFLTKSAVAMMGTLLGAHMVHGSHFPKGLLPVGLMSEEGPLPGKHPDMIVLNDRPWNIETPVHLLDDKVTPADKMFVRNNGLPPVSVDSKTWTLTIDGESVSSPKTYSLEELKKKFKHYSYNLVLECGGNTRKEFFPPPPGNQWGYGAVSCGTWTGVRLKDILNDVGIGSDAVYIGYYGSDIHLSGDAKKVVISRGVPIAKAMEDEVLVAFQLNGEDIPAIHGYPLRLVVGGWPASASGKWLNKIVVRNKVHDGPKMEGDSYRVPCKPVAPGSEVKDEDMCIIHEMPVKSIITYPKTAAMVKPNQTFKIRGHAWAGDRSVSEVEVSTDFGMTWKKCELTKALNKNAWQQFSTEISLAAAGYYEVWAKATDDQGIAQPMVSPGWNPKGYLNNSAHRIAVKVQG
jgi:sulfite oxidase